MMKGGKGASSGGGGGACKGSGGPQVAEVRFHDPSHAQAAVQFLNGSSLNGTSISVEWDASSKDGSKLQVSNIPAGVRWEQVKEHFQQCGEVAFAGYKDGK